jgi:hypothetical protein
MNRIAVPFALVFSVVAAAGAAQAKVIVAPLTPHHTPTSFALQDSGKTVAITVRDERPDKSFLSGALIGPSAEQGKGIYLGYATENDDDLARFMEAAALEAASVLGVKQGDGARLEIVVKDFRVDMYRRSGFSPMNCIAYGLLAATLTAADGSVLKARDLKVAYYDNAVPVMSMKEVTAKGLSRIYSLAAWQATAAVLIDAWGITFDAETLAGLARRVDAEKDEDPAREMVFWLGLAGAGDSATKEKLLNLYRSSPAQKVHQTAVEALGLLGIAEPRDEMRDVLAGRKTLGEWDIEDNEQVWYLLHALALMGDTDLEGARPATKIKMSSKLNDLLRFHATGALPESSAAEEEKAQKARKKLEEKRAR